MYNFRRVFLNSRPIQLLLGALTYTLGTGIIHYLGRTINLTSFAMGLLTIIALQAASAWLTEQFRLPSTPLQAGETVSEREHYRIALLQSSYAALTLAVAIILSLFVTGRLNLPAFSLIGVIILFLVVYALPPMQLGERGYGELILAVYLGTLLPSLSFLLQYGEFHRLLTFATFPLTLLALAYFLVCDFPTYATDQKLGRHSLLTRLTWQRAIPVHHLLLLAAFLLFSSAPFFGFPWGLVWPVLIVIPFAAVQAIWLQRISWGGPTFWSFLTNLSLATFGLAAYLLAFTFWIR